MRQTTPSPARPFELRYTVPAQDIDEQGRANNVAYVRWMNVVAIAHSAAVGFPWERFLEMGEMFVVRRHEIDYRLPAFLGDELLLRTWPTMMRAATAHRHHEIRRASDGALIASGMNVWAYVNITTGKPVRMPPAILDAFDPAKYA